MHYFIFYIISFHFVLYRTSYTHIIHPPPLPSLITNFNLQYIQYSFICYCNHSKNLKIFYHLFSYIFRLSISQLKLFINSFTNLIKIKYKIPVLNIWLIVVAYQFVSDIDRVTYYYCLGLGLFAISMFSVYIIRDWKYPTYFTKTIF